MWLLLILRNPKTQGSASTVPPFSPKCMHESFPWFSHPEFPAKRTLFSNAPAALRARFVFLS